MPGMTCPAVSPVSVVAAPPVQRAARPHSPQRTRSVLPLARRRKALRLEFCLLASLALAAAGCVADAPAFPVVLDEARQLAVAEGRQWDALQPWEQQDYLRAAYERLLEERTSPVAGVLEGLLPFLPPGLREVAAGMLAAAGAGGGYLAARQRSRAHLRRFVGAAVRGRLPTALARLDAACGGRHTAELDEPEAPAVEARQW